jgi:hypothetical protein
MHAPSRWSVYSVMALVGLGVGYDSGLFSSPLGSDHLAVVLVPSIGSTIAQSGGIIYYQNSVTGEDIAMPQSLAVKTTQV